ncbi:hypothetical protein K469DRAFT_707637 [Zopfia rhizophila CBS 207.26]|uniref:Uncharacterized protein n=1 Tax=Zopfia rhizophila CBS 207.26 TaxID=1314779 RepID=A0A6A6D8E2_9PEZI|nr:hypothetical protein K469DRAFT_707637 [Zopfia rhizophila CBS 207.26]
MAETLGVVAGGVAVIQIVSQVSSGILKLRALLEEIKNVPPMLARLIDGLEILVPLLTEVEAIQANFPPGDLGDATLKLCIQHCRRSSQAIADMAISLSQEINSTRRVRRLSASLKVILNKDTLARLERELAGAMQLLMLAQQSYMTAVFRHNHDVLISMVAPTGPPKQPDCLDSLCQHAKADSQTDSGDAHRSKWQYLPSSWRSQLLGFTATSGWQMSIRSHPVRARDSQPFVYIRDGNLSGLLECFKRGEANPLDQDRNGWSLVHHAALGQHINICTRLLDMGVDINERANHQMTVLRCFASANPSTPPSQANLDFIGYLLSHGAEYERYEGEPPEQQLATSYRGTTGSFLLLQSHLFPHYYGDTLQTRLRCALRVALNPWRGAAEFRVSLRRDGEICGKDVAESIEYHLPILNLALLGLGIRLQNPATVSDVPNWQSLIRVVLSCYQTASEIVPLPMLDASYITSACSGQIERATPLFCVIIGTLRGAGHTTNSWKVMVANAVQLWAGTAQAVGLDVGHYGRAEQANFEDHCQHNWFHLGRKTWTRGIVQLERLRLSSQMETWDLAWNEYIDDVLSQDGSLESRHCTGVPGAWVEDDLSDCRCSCV